MIKSRKLRVLINLSPNLRLSLSTKRFLSKFPQLRGNQLHPNCHSRNSCLNLIKEQLKEHQKKKKRKNSFLKQNQYPSTLKAPHLLGSKANLQAALILSSQVRFFYLI
jgi:hypothetical protein